MLGCAVYHAKIVSKHIKKEFNTLKEANIHLAGLSKDLFFNTHEAAEIFLVIKKKIGKN